MNRDVPCRNRVNIGDEYAGKRADADDEQPPAHAAHCAGRILPQALEPGKEQKYLEHWRTYFGRAASPTPGRA